MRWENRSTSEPSAPACADDRRKEPLRVVWLLGHQPYRRVWDLQREIHTQRCSDHCPDTLLLLEHLPVVSIGRNGDAKNLTVPEAQLRGMGIDLVRTDRGGDITYHGPGQLVGYPIIDLKEMRCGIRRFVQEIEDGIIRAVAAYGIDAHKAEGKTGVWVGSEKLASIGLKAGRSVTMHGFALNVCTDLTAFDLIVPCGIQECTMTSMERLGGATAGLRDVGDTVTKELAGLWGRRVVMETDCDFTG